MNEELEVQRQIAVILENIRLEQKEIVRCLAVIVTQLLMVIVLMFIFHFGAPR